MGTDVAKSQAWVFIAALAGWGYFSAWSISFYPQVWTNYRYKSTEGLSSDFAIYNVVGFSAYSAFTLIRYTTQKIYHLADSVEPQDLAFALHAFVLATVGLGQVIRYNRGQVLATTGKCCILMSLGAVIGLLVNILLIICGVMPVTSNVSNPLPDWTLTDYLGLVKIIVTLTKYIPQLILNAQRKLTIGMAVWGFNLDLIGGILSLSQNTIEAINYSNMDYLTENVPKLVIGLITLVYDMALLCQHYVLYSRYNHKVLEQMESIDDGRVRKTSSRIEGIHSDNQFREITTVDSGVEMVTRTA